MERLRPTCRDAARCCQTKQVPKKGVAGKAEEEKGEEGRRSYDSSVAAKKRSPTPLYYPLLISLEGGTGKIDFF